VFERALLQWLTAVDKRIPIMTCRSGLRIKELIGPLNELQIIGPVAEGIIGQWELVPNRCSRFRNAVQMAARMAQVPLFLASSRRSTRSGIICKGEGAPQRRRRRTGANEPGQEHESVPVRQDAQGEDPHGMVPSRRRVEASSRLTRLEETAVGEHGVVT